MASESGLLIELKGALPNSQFHLPGSREYERLNDSYRSATNVSFRPGFIFLPRTKEEISTFLRITSDYVLNGAASFAIVGNGQQVFPGCNNTDDVSDCDIDAFTVNLSALKGVEIQDGLVRIAAGERWNHVYRVLEKEGLGVAGPNGSDAGVAGQALHGGIPFFYSRHGFICDNVINYEVVLASGEIVNASASSHADLWRALRGGGNNFGIVTRFDMRTHKQGEIFGGVFSYPLTELPGQIQALVDELTAPNPSKDTHITLEINHHGQEDIQCRNHVYFNDSIDRAPWMLEPFLWAFARLPQFAVRKTTFADAARTRNPLPDDPAAWAPRKKRYAIMNTTLKADFETLRDATDIFQEILADVCQDRINYDRGTTFSLSLVPLTRAMLAASASQGGNSLGLSPDAGPLVSVCLLAHWPNPSQDAPMNATVERILVRIRARALESGHAAGFVHGVAAHETQRPVAPESEEALREVSGKYDPDGVFQYGVPGVFKLWDDE